MPKNVVKRDGVTRQPFDMGKLLAAIGAAWLEVRPRSRGDLRERAVAQVAEWVATHALVGDGDTDVETIQDVVEIALMKFDYFDVAKAYILYRRKRAEARTSRAAADPAALADYIHPSKYARYLPDKRRRELFDETVDRVEAMHVNRFRGSEALPLIQGAFTDVREKRVLPSMRSMQFAGEAIEVNHARMYNCAFTYIDRPRAFAETLWLLLCGTGTGYSVQFHHVDKLPALGSVSEARVLHHSVQDSIEGWAEALNVLVHSYMPRDVFPHPAFGMYVEFDFSGVRSQGSPLKTSGGRAPGHLKLKRSLEAIRAILDGAVGRKLRPFECHEIQCHSADAVLSGGIRRSAMISLFSHDDDEMLLCKTGRWYERRPWLKNANNSAVLLRGEVTARQFHRVISATRQWGEPGFYFTDSLEYGTNPCAEIGLYPTLHVEGAEGQPLTVTGWSFCNLTEINAAKIKDRDDAVRAARSAAIIGTLQGTYTTFPYLTAVTEEIAKRDALLGVSMTGMMDSPIVFDPAIQGAMARAASEANEEVARLLRVNPAARVTTVKPSGTTSLALGGVASGIHPHHARRYIRRVVANEDEVVFRYFRSINPHMCVRKPDGDWVIEFPVQAPEGARVKADLGAVQLLEAVRGTHESWVLPGTRRQDPAPGLTHNVSNTVHVRPDEWAAVEAYIWEHRATFAGVSLLSHTGDKDYAFAPNEAIVTEADEARWNQLVSNYTPVDYSAMVEWEDGTAATASPACDADKCELPTRGAL